MKLLALTAVAALITAPPVTLKASIRAHLNRTLFDGPSARYQWQPVRSARVYCAHVNARNLLGAYTGWRLFYVITDGSPVKAVFDSERLALASTVCRENGYQVTL